MQCILPPHILDAIIQNGTPEQRAEAERSAALSTTIRAARTALGTPAVEAPRAPADGEHRVVYSADGATDLPGRQVRAEGEPPSTDPAVNEAYDGAGATYDLYKTVYNRDSVDNKGLRLDSTVHYGKQYDNAFWNGEQMIYGDGDESLPPGQQLFLRFTRSIDVIGHELTHGVTQYTAGLNYLGQSGALNESISDVFGSLVRQRAANQSVTEADWLIGKELLSPNVKGQALRSMKAPGTAYDDPVLGKDPQPATMQNYVNTTSDNGGVHINSGIPNHAFYVAAMNIGGKAWEKAGQIWYVTLRDKLNPIADFQAAANATFATAGALFGTGSMEQQAVRQGWAEVGITVVDTPPTPPVTDNQGCLDALLSFWRTFMKNQ
ncbi:MAG TPA: M4 family metallopeptidase, partial [Aggregatilineales bacterium]|nr:M4 family metallopeptidase [Aggregatilineales bacterium]